MQGGQASWKRWSGTRGEDASWDEVWKLVEFAKDSWPTKETMKHLRNDDGLECDESDDDKL